ncbi:Brevican core protein [Amphibalanus amphitrite]|uniref:Brevican core protein n=1 Tax=Amphibalanus amphitrite TaxID=1232801 RepID=A0A6A4WY98_AMPAM|nr:brevican core protein-like [Amphibalanus amphitrite]KAF0308784.1 Brevican core protein [Amphibalanus amphitrite]
MAPASTVLCLALLGLAAAAGPYGSSHSSSQYGARRPGSTYGAPSYKSYTPPTPNKGYGAPKPSASYGAPKYDNAYQAPKYDGGYDTPKYDSGYQAPKYDGGYDTPKYDNGYQTPKYDSGYGARPVAAVRVQPGAGQRGGFGPSFGGQRPKPVQRFQQPSQPFPPQGGRGGLYVSWENPRHSGGQYTWDQAAGECRQLGLRLVSLTSPQKEQEINRRLPRGGRKVEFYWTSGQRLSEGGQFVWNDGARTPVCNRGQGCYQNWGPTGGAGFPQPDNREGRENCLAVLNEFYPGEGIVWHDIGCHHRKHFVCE